MITITETIYAEKDNVFSLQLIRGGEPINMAVIGSYKLVLSNGKEFTASSAFLAKPDGVVEISVGELLTQDDLGSHKAYLITYDPANTHGVQWPTFKLKVK